MKEKVFQTAIDIVRTNDTITLSDLLKQGYTCAQSIEVMCELLDKGIIKDAGEGVFAVVADESNIDDVAIDGGAIKRKLSAEKMDEIVELLDGKTMDALKRIFQHEKTWRTGIDVDDDINLVSAYDALVENGLAVKREGKYFCTLYADDYDDLCAKYRDYMMALRMERIKKKREDFKKAQKQNDNKTVFDIGDANVSGAVGTRPDVIWDEDDKKTSEDFLSGEADRKKKEVKKEVKKEKPSGSFDILTEQIKKIQDGKQQASDVAFYALVSNGKDEKIRVGIDEKDMLMDVLKKTAKEGGNSALMKTVGGAGNLIKFLSSDVAEKDKCGAFCLQAKDVKIDLNWTTSVFEQCKTKLGELLGKDSNAVIEIVFYNRSNKG